MERPIVMRLAELCDYTVGGRDNGHSGLDGEITGIACDSRKVAQGNLFVAIPGTCVDGHDFVDEALSRGAAAVVTEREVRLPENVP
ncbi:MAG: Mur ligase domain-containing protein, partial [Candidatus Brocadiales bacterium]